MGSESKRYGSHSRMFNRTRVGADVHFRLAQSLMFSADPDFGGKELDMSFFQRRYEMLRPPPLLEAWGLMIVERRPEQPPYTVAHEASHTVCPTVGHAAAAMNTALRWSIDSNDEFEIQVRSVRNDPTDHLGESCARAARWFTDPTQMENHRFKTLHSQAGVWGRGPIPDAVLTISVAESNDQAERWQLMRQKNEREYQTHAESLAQSRATSVAGEDTQTRSSKQVTFSEPDDTTGDGSSDDTTDEGSSDDATVDGWPDDDQL